MLEPHTLREISSAVAKAEGRPDEERIFQQLKGASARGLMRPVDTHGPKGALRFDRREIAKARLILRAVDSGMTGDTLAGFENDLRVELRKALPNGEQVTLSLAEAVSSVFEVYWLLEVVVTRGAVGEPDAGELQQSVRWLYEGNRFDEVDPLDPGAFIRGKIIEEVRFIPFSALIRPIFVALDEAMK